MKILKQIILLGVSACAALDVCFGQTYYNSPDDTFRLSGMMEDLQTLTITQHNISGNTMTLAWKKVSENVPLKWDALVCDNRMCYASLEDSGTMNPVLADDSGFLLLHITGHVNYGTAAVRYAVWNLDYPALIDTLTFILTIDKTSALEGSMSKNHFSLFPNPAVNCVDILSDLQGFAYSLITATGMEVKAGLSNTDSISIPIENLPQGIYYLQLKSDDAIYTQKIIKQ